MPLTPATTDKFQKVGTPGTATTLSAPGYTIGGTSLTVGSTTNWPTDTLVPFAVDRATIVNGLEVRTAGTYNEFVGIVTGASTISNLVQRYGTAQNYAAGSLTRVYIPVSSTRENDLIDGLNQDHNGKGNHKTLTDDNGNEWLERGSVASAVNQVKATNAVTGGKPLLSASGDDTNIDLRGQGKGTGRFYADYLPPQTFAAQSFFDHVVSGGVWTGDSYGVNLNASMTAMVCVINGRYISIAAVTARAFTTNVDTYIDVLDNADGTGTLVYTTAATNAASPALAANSIRIGIIQAAATITAATKVNQGQEDRVFPIASSIPYAVTDSLGNLICPRDPNRKVLGYRQILSNFTTTSTTDVQVTGLSVPVIVPVGRKIKITAYASFGQCDTASRGVSINIWDGVVSSGTKLENAQVFLPTVNTGTAMITIAATTPAAASKTYNFGGSIQGGAGTATLGASSVQPTYLLVELV